MNRQEMIERYNQLSGKKPITNWKQKLSVLAERIAQLEGTTTTLGETTTESPEQTETAVPVDAEPKEKPVAKAKKTSKKTPAKKAAKKTSAPKNGASLSAFVAELHAKGKGNKEILEAATAKGFETTYGSVASLRSRINK